LSCSIVGCSSGETMSSKPPAAMKGENDARRQDGNEYTRDDEQTACSTDKMAGEKMDSEKMSGDMKPAMKMMRNWAPASKQGKGRCVLPESNPRPWSSKKFLVKNKGKGPFVDAPFPSFSSGLSPQRGPHTFYRIKIQQFLTGQTGPVVSLHSSKLSANFTRGRMQLEDFFSINCATA